jgi:hypothetical protein
VVRQVANQMSDTEQEVSPEASEAGDTSQVELTPQELEFISKRDAIAEALRDDLKFRQCIAELYMFISDFNLMMQQIGKMGGPKAMLKMMMGGRGNNE